MKGIITLYGLLFFTISTLAQNFQEDTARILKLTMAQNESIYGQPDSGLIMADSIISLSAKINYLFGVAQGHGLKAECYWVKGDYTRSMYHVLEAAERYRQMKADPELALSKASLAQIYFEIGDYNLALQYYFELRNFLLGSPDTLNFRTFQVAKEDILMGNNLDLAKSYLLGNRLDSALFYGEMALTYNIRLNQMWSYCSLVVGNILERMNRDSTALAIYNLKTTWGGQNDLVSINIGKAIVFNKMHLVDSCRYYAKQALESAQANHYLKSILQASELLSSTYEQNNPAEFINYIRIANTARDSLYGKEKINQLNGFLLNNALRQRDKEAAEIKYRNQKRTFLLLMISAIFLITGSLLWRNNQFRKKSNTLLQLEKEKVENALVDLKSTQAQLIQSEKMASLGELTAGIAHEIQNPLNFVNNFSEINGELIKELKNEVINGDLAGVTSIALDIESNSEKINQHGKRAEAIVKGMLQHSQKSSGTREPTNINDLVEEYLRLAYHAFQAGYRARDQNFSAELKLDLDPTLPLVSVIPQDIGRVLLNLFNNAFWACAERRLGTVGYGTNLPGLPHKANVNLAGLKPVYTPTINLTTKNLGDKIQISIKDNGAGVPQSIIDKIFQPFFTTKPTGQGTGLGLSLSYDIIKAHGGTISVNSFNNPKGGPPGGSINVISTYHEPGEIKVNTELETGSEFIIQLPA